MGYRTPPIRSFPNAAWKLGLLELAETWRSEYPTEEAFQEKLAKEMLLAKSDTAYQRRLAYPSKKEAINASCRGYRQRYRDKIQERDKIKYHERMADPDMREKERKRCRESAAERRKSDENFALKSRLRCRVKNALKFNKKSASTEELCGCSFEELKLRIASMFEDGMMWQNWKLGDNCWHLDHRVPCDFFDLSDPVQQKKCFHYSNLQPLWQADNLRKAASLEG